MISEHGLFLHRRERNLIINKCALNLKSQKVQYTHKEVWLHLNLTLVFLLKISKRQKMKTCGSRKKWLRAGTKGGEAASSPRKGYFSEHVSSFLQQLTTVSPMFE